MTNKTITPRRWPGTPYRRIVGRPPALPVVQLKSTIGAPTSHAVDTTWSNRCSAGRTRTPSRNRSRPDVPFYLPVYTCVMFTP